jgi:hypothetical protein
MGIEVTKPFANHRDAGRRLVARLVLLPNEGPNVVAPPCAGVPVAKELVEGPASPPEEVVDASAARADAAA